jgi:hypothetical protein
MTPLLWGILVGAIAAFLGLAGGALNTWANNKRWDF